MQDGDPHSALASHLHHATLTAGLLGCIEVPRLGFRGDMYGHRRYLRPTKMVSAGPGCIANLPVLCIDGGLEMGNSSEDIP